MPLPVSAMVTVSEVGTVPFGMVTLGSVREVRKFSDSDQVCGRYVSVTVSVGVAKRPVI